MNLIIVEDNQKTYIKETAGVLSIEEELNNATVFGIPRAYNILETLKNFGFNNYHVEQI